MIILFKKNICKLIIFLFVSLIALGCGSGGSDPEPTVSAPIITPPVTTPPVVTPPVIGPSGDYTEIALKSSIQNVQPMTGIVLWDNHEIWDSANKSNMADAISLEYSYISINKIVTAEGVYDWSYIENKLNAIASRNHQAIFRLYYAYVGRETTVPDYIKALPDYSETVGLLSEGEPTSFPDWTNSTLQEFTKTFHTKFAERYNNDNRIAFLQVGFGLWGEYHIYDEPDNLVLGQTFPSKAYQTEFLTHVNSVYTLLPWSISIDASNSEDTPIIGNSNLLELNFGLFDDSFMHEEHSDYNESAWNTFNYSERYKIAPLGGEFSYNEPSDQRNVLIPETGAYGISYEDFAEKFHISYIIGNDAYTTGKSNEQPIARIKEASVFSGYEFTITAFTTNDTSAEITIENSGIAPIYYDAYITVNGVRSSESLKGLLPDEFQKYLVESGGDTPVLTIESDYILSTQKIEFNADL